MAKDYVVANFISETNWRRWLGALMMLVCLALLAVITPLGWTPFFAVPALALGIPGVFIYVRGTHRWFDARALEFKDNIVKMEALVSRSFRPMRRIVFWLRYDFTNPVVSPSEWAGNWFKVSLSGGRAPRAGVLYTLAQLRKADWPRCFVPAEQVDTGTWREVVGT